MNPWCNTLTVLALAGALPAATAATATVYYHLPYKGWSTANIHHNASGAWTAVPGTPMDTACAGGMAKTLDFSTTSFETVFNNGSSAAWDNLLTGGNYILPSGIHQVREGTLRTNAGNPCNASADNQAQVYYKLDPAWSTANIHYAPNGGAWTAVPGVAMDVACTGWRHKQVPLGAATGLAVTFNNGSVRDNNGGRNCALTTGITRVKGCAVSFQASSPSYVDNSGMPDTVYGYAVVVQTCAPSVPSGQFSWDNATVYFLLNDRFVNADTGNDRGHCRESTQACVSFGNDLTQMPSGFHGGDLKGITQKIHANYFKDLGVDALWITAPYEQIHGFVFGGNGHKHYGYHGYYPLDWTAIDQNMGSRADLQDLVDAAHAQGMRVVMDVVLNHTGYETLKDMAEYGYGALNAGWENTAYKSADVLTDWNTDVGQYINYASSHWVTTFWTPAWIRMNNAAGYSACEGTDGLRGCVGYLPDIKTELGTGVALPSLLNVKWSREGRLATEQQKLDAWFRQTGRARTPANHLIKWLTDYVREFGIDGFRVDTAKHVGLGVWKDLKAEASRARQDWLAANPAKAALLKGDTGFWMTGEVWGHGVNRSSYFDNGFDSLINFSFQGAAGNTGSLDGTYTQLAGVNADNSTPYNMLSFISSHDSGLFDRNNLQTGLSSLLLAPGAVQIFYGDESARPLMGHWSGDHAWRGGMNWASPNQALLAHAQKLGRFRRVHVAVGAGRHAKLADSPYTFARIKDADKVVIALGASGTVQVSVADVFADGTWVRDAYTGAQATVSSGRVSVAAGSAGVVLLEAVAP